VRHVLSCSCGFVAVLGVGCAPADPLFDDSARAVIVAQVDSATWAFDAVWSDLEVRALGPDAAIATFRFRDSIVTGTGETSVLEGPTTLAWERRGEDWLIVFVDADHYPPTPADPAPRE